MKYKYIKALSRPIAEDVNNLAADYRGSADNYIEIVHIEQVERIRQKWPLLSEVSKKTHVVAETINAHKPEESAE